MEFHKNTNLLNGYILAVYLFFITCAFLSGCAIGRLDQVLINEIPARMEQMNAVQIIRENRVTVPNLRMELKQGDEIKTDSESTAIILLQGGSKVIIGPDSHIRLINPNHIIEMLSAIGDKISKIFVEAKAALQVKTVYIGASCEGTNFQVTLDPNNEVSVTVLEGIVRLESMSNRFSPVWLTRFRKATVCGEHPPNVVSIDKNEGNSIIEWINRIEKIGYNTNAKLLLPDVLGMPVNEAVQVLRSAGFSVIKKAGGIISGETLDIIIEQSPAAGTRMQRGDPVFLYFGADLADVPSLFGLTIEEAILRLSCEDKLSLGDIEEKLTGTADTNSVIEQTPPAHTAVPAGSKVNLVIEAKSVIMPNLINLHIKEAWDLISEKNLKRGKEEKEPTPESDSEGAVIGQSIPAGTRVHPGRAVDLTVTETGVLVPNLKNIKFQEAVEIVENAKLHMGEITWIKDSKYSPETIISQRPEAETLVLRGSAVSLKVAKQMPSDPNLPTPPNPPPLQRPSPPKNIRFFEL